MNPRIHRIFRAALATTLATTLGLGLAVTSTTGAAFAQDDAPTPAVEASGPLSASMDVSSPVVSQEDTVTVILRVMANEDTKVDATVLSGQDLSVQIEGEKAKPISKPVAGKIDLAAGTMIERKMMFPVSTLAPNVDGVAHVTLSWKGLAGANVSFKVLADVSQISIDDMDLAETQVMIVTNYGEILVGFYPDKAPNHVRNFIELSKSGFYDGTKFHRVIKGFMLQGGDPNTKEGATGQPGLGNSGKNLDAEFNDTRHTRGILSMARSPSGPNTASSQFFVMHGDAPHLDGQYSAFGHTIQGIDVVDIIANVPANASKPVAPVILQRAIVIPAMKKK